MDIKQATEQIKGAIRAYLSKNDRGLYRIPFHMQRPIIMFGPPGVGKTAIVAQIAEEMDINFVAYSITHHTRQSALGLPFISSRTYGDRDYNISEYTMSEIIPAVYDAVKESGVHEGILFLDEVNCVSETLAPVMLQFLQYKTFGQHRLPEGWIIVTAGNPPEYNRSAREFDPVTMDRLKRIDVEPNVQVWQEYASSHGVHPAITTYIDSKPGSFYKVQAGVKGSRMVTARGWEDLSRIVLAYEAEGIPVTVQLVRQYLQDDATAEDFTVYYELFCKYRDDYKVTEILAGKADESIVKRAASARFDERIALVGLLLDAVIERAHYSMEYEEALRATRADVVDMMSGFTSTTAANKAIERRIGEVKKSTEVGKRQKGMVGDKDVIKAERLRILGDLRSAVLRSPSEEKAPTVAAAKAAFNAECKKQAKTASDLTAGIDSAFRFLDSAFGNGQESLIFITKLSADPVVIKHVSLHGSEEFMKHNKSLLFTERSLDLLSKIEALDEQTIPEE